MAIYPDRSIATAGKRGHDFAAGKLALARKAPLTRDRPAVMWSGVALAVVGLLERWLEDRSGSALGIALVWELLTDRAACDLLWAALGAVAGIGFVAAVTAT